MKQCLECGTEIILKRSNNRTHYCGEDCREIGNKKKVRIANAKRYVPVPKACDNCGKIVTEKRMAKNCRACLKLLKITECVDCGSPELVGKRKRCEPCREKKRVKKPTAVSCQFCFKDFTPKRASSKTCYNPNCQKMLKAHYNVTFTSVEKEEIKIETKAEKRARQAREKVELRDLIKITLNISDIGATDRFSLEECGNVLGVTKERARQIEDSALRKIKSPQTGRLLSKFRFD